MTNLENDPDNYQKTYIVNQEIKQSNGIGTAGFILAIIALFVGWIPVIGWLVWLLGAIFSLVGVFRSPKGLSIAGLIISFFGIIMLILTMIGLSAAMLL